ncbi:PaaI family thioesterase [Frankia sp. B2]|nr:MULTISPECIES: PaaI family thioesterase [unclassified Frankia]OAA20626.1 thioesterase superfamily enzyme [Frankia casuarinae]ETA00625.1 hypothetical protein CcI6DRAFT_03944 [Frankia sp. CcI6]KDA41581.1 hypothetical protein BMG523Draft_03583 [Frankia sp. BMG5.23]KFB03146.1 thioesterase superfamily enzyme [Frankia sp. Allo2]OFB40625.1 thioesterase [Frankia sp. CgIM4]
MHSHLMTPSPDGPREADDPEDYLSVPWSVLADYRCFGCSPHNPHGLQLRFSAHADGISTRFRLERRHESYPGVVHGGLIGVIVDETMGNLIVLQVGLTAFTTALRVRYLAPLSVGAEYRCVARLRGVPDATPGRGDAAPVGGTAGGTAGGVSGGRANGLVHAEAELLDEAGTLLATASATYRPTPMDTARDRMMLNPTEADRVAQALAATLTRPPATGSTAAGLPTSEEH